MINDTPYMYKYLINIIIYKEDWLATVKLVLFYINKNIIGHIIHHYNITI